MLKEEVEELKHEEKVFLDLYQKWIDESQKHLKEKSIADEMKKSMLDLQQELQSMKPAFIKCMSFLQQMADGEQLSSLGWEIVHEILSHHKQSDENMRYLKSIILKCD